MEFNGEIWGLTMMGVILGPGGQSSAEMDYGTYSYGADFFCVCVLSNQQTVVGLLLGWSCLSTQRCLLVSAAMWLEREPGRELYLSRLLCPPGVPPSCFVIVPPASLISWHRATFGLALGALASPTLEASAQPARPSQWCLHRMGTPGHSRFILKAKLSSWSLAPGCRVTAGPTQSLVGLSLQVWWRGFLPPGERLQVWARWTLLPVTVPRIGRALGRSL